MKAIEFEEVNLRVAENQEQYMTLPVYHNPSRGTIMFCLELDDEEKAYVAEHGKMFMKMTIGDNDCPPLQMSCLKEELYEPMTTGLGEVALQMIKHIGDKFTKDNSNQMTPIMELHAHFDNEEIMNALINTAYITRRFSSDKHDHTVYLCFTQLGFGVYKYMFKQEAEAEEAEEEASK